MFPTRSATAGRKLIVLSYDGLTIGSSVENVPDLIERIYTRKGSEGSALRRLRNHVVFVVADGARKAEMRRKTYHRLALRELKKPERLIDLPVHQQAKVRGAGSRRSELGTRDRHSTVLPARVLSIPQPGRRE